MEAVALDIMSFAVAELVAIAPAEVGVGAAVAWEEVVFVVGGEGSCGLDPGAGEGEGVRLSLAGVDGGRVVWGRRHGGGGG